MPNLTFTTTVSGEKDGQFFLRGKNYSELIDSFSYTQALFLSITGKVPTKQQTELLDAILVACFDHGIAPASGFVPRVVAASGNESTHALASGILALGPYHGGAIENASLLLSRIKEENLVLSELVQRYRQEKKIFFGYGHKRYKDIDPRTKALFHKADAVGIANTYRGVAVELEREIEKVLGKRLVLNIDGAVAALLLDLGFPPKAGNAIFALARMGGMIAHVLEEYDLNQPVRRLDESQIEYTDP